MQRLERLAAEAGIDREDDRAVNRIDGGRKQKMSLQPWRDPHDPDAELLKMKDGTKDLPHMADQALDPPTGAIFAPTINEAATGHTPSLEEVLQPPGETIWASRSIRRPTMPARLWTRRAGRGHDRQRP